MPMCGTCKDRHETVQLVRECSQADHEARHDVFSYVGPNPWTTDGRSCEKCGGSGTYEWAWLHDRPLPVVAQPRSPMTLEQRVAALETRVAELEYRSPPEE